MGTISRVNKLGAATLGRVDLGGDGTADMAILLKNVTGLDGSDVLWQAATGGAPVSIGSAQAEPDGGLEDYGVTGVDAFAAARLQAVHGDHALLAA